MSFSLSPAESRRVAPSILRQRIAAAAWRRERTTFPRFLFRVLSLFRSWIVWTCYALLILLPCVAIPLLRGKKLDPDAILLQSGIWLGFTLITFLLIGITGWFWIERRYPRNAA